MEYKRHKAYFFSFRLTAFLLFGGFTINLSGQSMGFPPDWGYWKRDLVLTSAFMGPNALPVPEIRNGNINQKQYVSLIGVGHFSSFDKTYNPILKAYSPFADGRVAIEAWSALFEYYNTDSLTLVERKAWDKNSKGYSSGDIYIATLVQVVRGHTYIPDMLISINLKTASGGNLETLRHTDTPGYYFDLSMGKSFRTAENSTVRPFGLIGFYAYQTHQPMHLQNDAIAWGIGFDYCFSKFSVTSSLGGYYGYFNQGDRPIVFRFKTFSKLSKSIDALCGVQLGIKDNSYLSLYFGLQYSIASPETHSTH